MIMNGEYRNRPVCIRGLSRLLSIGAFLCFFAHVFLAQEGRELTAVKPKISEKRIALVIGNGKYQHVSALDNPVNDATDISAALKALGFEVITGTDTNLVQMRRLIRQFGEQLERQKGVGLFYYAGHGVEVRGRNYLVPVDANISREVETEDYAIDVNLILTHMDDANNGFNIVILDACRNNPFSRGWIRSVDTGGLANVNAPTGTFIAFAAAPGRTASDGKGTRNGIFTGALLKHLKRPNLKLEEVFKATREEVTALTARQQVPWDSSSIQGEFYFNPSKTVEPQTQAYSPAPVPKPTPLPTATPVSVMRDFDGDTDYWNLMKNRDTREDYEFYLAEYPTGKYSAEAKTRIEKFKQDELTRLKNVERAKWAESERLNTKDAYNAYLSSYPSGEFAANARTSIKTLDTLVERSKWRDAQNANTKESYNGYLSAYPNGEFANDARSGIKTIENREDQAKWDEVQILNRKSAFQSYLSAYPNGKHSAAARQKIQEFENAEALTRRENDKAIEKAKWDDAKRVNTVAGYKDYLNVYPRGEFASLARLSLRDLGVVVDIADAAKSSVTEPTFGAAKPDSALIYSFVVQVSDDIRLELENIKRLSKQVVQTNGKNDSTSVIRFVGRDTIEVAQPFTANMFDLNDTLDNLSIVSGLPTAMIDAVYLAIEGIEAEVQKDKLKRVVLVTNGDDRESFYSSKDLYKKLREAKIPVLIVGLTYLPNASGTGPQRKAVDLLNGIADASGGRVFFARSSADLPEIGRQIVSLLRAS